MKALTLWRPWGTAILRLGKDIENRTWEPPASVIGQRIAIHNGQKLERDVVDWTIERWRSSFGLELSDEDVAGPAQHIIGVARVVDFVRLSSSLWFSGPVGWRLAAPIALPKPLPIRGMQGLWTVPPELERAILEQLAKIQICRVCECYDLRACPGGCSWVERDLCSACVR